MKILAAIQSSENAKTLSRTTLRWAARAGFNMRVFIPNEEQLPDYKKAITDANYRWHLAIPDDFIIVGTEPIKYAKDNNYDLIVYLPDHMNKWRQYLNHELNPLYYAKDVGRARVMLGGSPELRSYKFHNDVVMERV